MALYQNKLHISDLFTGGREALSSKCYKKFEDEIQATRLQLANVDPSIDVANRFKFKITHLEDSHQRVEGLEIGPLRASSKPLVLEEPRSGERDDEESFQWQRRLPQRRLVSLPSAGR